MENENIPQPLDALMNKLGVTNADLVKASTEQLSFKMVQKGRKGRRLNPRIQDKVLTALLTVKPELKLRRRDLFRYELDEASVEQIESALSRIEEKKIKYPQFVDLLLAAGVNRYAVDIASGKITFFGAAGEAHVIQGPIIDPSTPRTYNEDALRVVISDAKKELIDHVIFLKRIYGAGILAYEANLRSRKIDYKGETQAHRENIPQAGAEPQTAVQGVSKTNLEKKAEKSEKAKRKKKAVIFKKSGRSGKYGKMVLKHRVKKTTRFRAHR